MSSASPELGERLEAVRSDISHAAREADRDPASLQLIVVTKFHPESLIRDLIELGQVDFGENRHQEAVAKAADLAGTPARWHFIGQLQSNKARAVREYANVVHSLDRESLIPGLAGGTAPLDVFAQVDLGSEPGRGGVSPAGLDALVDRVVAASGLRLLGLMTVAPLGMEPRRAFASLRELGEGIRGTAPEATALSMGMSGDYREAILEGATHLRIGSAITGNRPTNG